MKCCRGIHAVLMWAMVLAMLLVPSAMAQEGAWGRHDRAFVVPTPDEVTIDGRLDDWDRSPAILMYAAKATSAMQSARISMMYDDEALYVAGKVLDNTPMMNRHDPQVDGNRAWDADACQIRIARDPAMGWPATDNIYGGEPGTDEPLTTLLLWYYTDREEANLQLQHTMAYHKPNGWPKGVVPKDKFEGAYRKHEDGAGYTFEYRIPWETMDADNPPGAGDLVAGNLQVNWSRPDGLKTKGTAGWAYDVMSQPGFPYQTARCWGKFIFTDHNDLPRTMVEKGAELEKPLPLEFEYELPRSGDMTVALYDQRGVLVRQLAAEVPREQGRVIEKWDGLNELGDPIEPGMYTWRGIVHDPIETEFVMSVHNSGQPPYKTSDNTGGWGADHGEPTTVCAAGEHMVLAWHHAETGWGIIRTRLNGRKQWGSKHGASHVASDGERFFKAGGGGSLDHAGVAVFDLTDSRPLNFGRGEPTTELPEDVSESPDAVTGLAHHAGRIFSAFENVNLIAVNDADSGALLDTWTVPQPRQLAVHHDGALLVVSGERVLLVRDGEHETLINDHLDAPTGIATDDEDNIYVANTGALQNVSVFNRNGEYQRSIGKQGGRPRMGRYDPAGMLEPGGIDIDREGKLWVAETLDFPKRISVWNIESGELVDEFFGGSAYSPFPWMDPKKPDEIYCHRVIWKVDLDKKTKRPYSTVWRTDAPNVVRAPAVGANSRQRVITAENGRQFLWGDYRHQARLFMRDGDIFKPIAGGIHLHPEGRWGNRQRHPLLADEEEFPDGTYIWQDANDDQTLQAEEVQPLSGPLARSGVRISWVDAQMNLWTGRGHILRPQRFENERPIYDFQNPEPTNMELLGGHIWTDPHDDSVYSMRRFPEPEQLGVARYGTDGKMQWGYRGLIRWRHAISLSPPGPGKLLGPTNPLGVAGDFTGISTYFGTYHILTREGIYVAMLFDDSRSTGGKFGANVLSAETTNGQLVQPRGTNRYYVLTGDQDGRVMRVHGLDTVEPLDGGSVRITPRQHQRAENALRKYQQQKTRSDTLALVRGGKSKLASADGVIKTLGPKHAFTVRIAYDQANLYLQYDITAPHKLINTVSDPKLLFTGGNLLDLQIATSAARDGSRKQPAPGDKRLLIGRRPSGDTIAVLYQPRVAGFEGKPVVFKSPQDRESFDSIDVISDRIALGYEQTSAGFTATATIPLEVLDWQPPPASTVKLDVGYIFGNARGNNATRRAYWSNNSFHANVVDDVPDESRLEPDQWGTAIIE